MPTCFIVGAMADRLPSLPAPGDFVIAADGGLRALKAAGIAPDLIVGDFDSLGTVPRGDNVVCHPVRKDDTDMLLAVRLGLARGFREFRLYGGLGGRSDHTVANFQTLAFLASHGARGYLEDEQEVMTVIRNDTLSLPARPTGTLSVFAFGGQAKGVTLRGLSYELEGASLSPLFPLGVSNAFVGKAAEIRVEDGMLLIIISKSDK